jgi:predicted dehydrogenase
MNISDLTVAVVGLGSIGARHFNNLNALGVETVYVLRERGRTPPVALKGRVAKEFSSYQMLLDEKPDAVIIANPTHLHYTYLELALQRGIHAYVEKPVAHEFKSVEHLLSLEKKNKCVCFVGCQLRFDTSLQKIKEWLTEGRVGSVLSACCDVGEYLPDWHPYEDYRESYAARADQGGGVILTVIHEIDYLHWLFGQVRQCFGFGGNRTPLQLDVEDTALGVLETEQGIPIMLRMDYWRRPPVRNLNIVGTDGEISWDYHRGSAELTNYSSPAKEVFMRAAGWERNDLFIAALKDFLSSICNGSSSSIPLIDGISTLRTALGFKESIKSGKLCTMPEAGFLV